MSRIILKFTRCFRLISRTEKDVMHMLNGKMTRMTWPRQSNNDRVPSDDEISIPRDLATTRMTKPDSGLAFPVEIIRRESR